MLWAVYAIRFAVCAGVWICLRPTRSPVRHLLGWLVLPTIVGEIVVVQGCYVLRSAGDFSSNTFGKAVQLTFAEFGPGFHYALIGLLLVGAFIWRVALGSSSLPLALPGSVDPPYDLGSWSRVQYFVWVFVAALPAFDWIYYPAMDTVGHFLYLQMPAFKRLAGLLGQLFVAGLFNLAIAVWILGRRDSLPRLRRALSLPKISGLALAIALPAAVSVLISLGQLVFALCCGASGSSAQLGPHPISAYFMLPRAELFLLLLFAFTEEIIFRGLLQPAFIQRYGVTRGIFLLSIIFATAHLDGDFSPNLTDALVIFRLFVRLCAAIPLSFITGWISLRTGSVLPAIVAHGLLNISGESPLGPRLRHMGLLLYLLWSVLAYLLFRFWPVAIDSSEPKSNSSTSPHIYSSYP